jgi:hypothetical protein
MGVYADIAASLSFAEGLLPVTDRNGFTIFSVKKQNGVKRLFVTFRNGNGKSGLW